MINRYYKQESQVKPARVNLMFYEQMQGCGNTMPALSNLSRFLEDKLEISIHLSWDKDFIALAKKTIQIMRYIFFLFLENIML